MKKLAARAFVGGCSFLVVSVLLASGANAAPPRKDICPAPEGPDARQEAVKAACKYFNMVPKSSGGHSAFDARGNVISCLHFSCKPLLVAVATRKEDCVSFNPSTTTVKEFNSRWKIVDGSHWMFDFKNQHDEANRSLDIIKHYGMNQSCFVGRPKASFSYLLVSGHAPAGAFPGEDCLSFNPSSIEVKKISNRWKIVDGSHMMFDFDQKKNEAKESLAIIKKHGFKYSCFVGRPDPSFKYLRK